VTNGFDVGAGIDTLRRTPATCDALLRGGDRQLVHASEGPDTFSPFDVVGHLIDGEETDWMVRARLILAQGDERTFVPYDRFRHRERNRGRGIDELLDEFAALRAANLAELEAWALAPEQLDLSAEHPALGTVTLRQLLASWVVHDLGHVAQVARVLAKQHRDSVGPWRAYLPVLQDRPRPAS
jgi:hypothetical protein